MAAIENQPEEIQKGVQDLEKEITCPICQDHFQEPKILPCCHFYCKGCVQKLAWRAGANQPFACPECRSDTFLPQNDPDQLPTAFFVNRMIELHSRMEKAHGKVETLCEECSECKAVAFCRHCMEFICDNCVKVHKKMRAFSDHKVALLEELKKGGAKHILINIAQPPNCRIHDDEKMKIYCYDCKHLICRDCLLDDHTGHKYDFVKKAAPVIKQKLAKCLVPLKEVKVNLQGAKKIVRLTKSDIKLRSASAVDMVEQSFQQLHGLLEQRKREMLEKIASLMKRQLNSLNVQEKGIDMASGTIQSLVDFVERNIENSTLEELMEMHTQLLNRIDEETKKHQQSSGELEPVEEADIVVEVRCAEELKKLCYEKAFVTSLVDPAKSTVQGDGIKIAEINKLSMVTLHTVSPNGKPQKKPVVVKTKLTTISSGSVVEAKVKQGRSGTYEIEYTPCVRGRHRLEVTVNGLPVAGSPFPVLVKISPSQLCKPKECFSLRTRWSVAVNSKNEVVLATSANDIILLDTAGNQLRILSVSSYGLKGIFGIALDENDNIYLTDIGTKSVHKFDKNGKEIKAVSPAIYVKTFDPRGIAVSGDLVIVADVGNSELLCLTRSLDFKKTIHLHQQRPVGVACDKDGIIYACDYDGGIINVLTANGLSYSFGERDGILGTKLSHPHSICVDNEFVYVTEWGNEKCVSIFTKQGRFIASFGQKGKKEGDFSLPSGLAIDSDGVLYVCDVDNGRVQVFSF